MLLPFLNPFGPQSMAPAGQENTHEWAALPRLPGALSESLFPQPPAFLLDMRVIRKTQSRLPTFSSAPLAPHVS